MQKSNFLLHLAAGSRAPTCPSQFAIVLQLRFQRLTHSSERMPAPSHAVIKPQQLYRLLTCWHAPTNNPTARALARAGKASCHSRNDAMDGRATAPYARDRKSPSVDGDAGRMLPPGLCDNNIISSTRQHAWARAHAPATVAEMRKKPCLLTDLIVLHRASRRGHRPARPAPNAWAALQTGAPCARLECQALSPGRRRRR